MSAPSLREGRQPDEAISWSERLAQSWLMPSAYRFVATLLAMTVFKQH
ncbi:MAG: hypothetical protein GQF41_2673 [Candidatus Rifleibacterium amylolyticum]|nr:MAG: hypothetical protein GQF41_2673 [Candidatus Rifleibacterium amylolyticum]